MNIIKLKLFEAHDRKKQLEKEQAININQGVDDCMKKNPLSLALQEYSPYIYIFAHPRTHDNGVDKVMLYQPRLTKPEAQTNSYLFRAESHSDIFEVCWLLPPQELWGQYRKGNVTESELVRWSIAQFRTNKKKLEAPYTDDLSDKRVRDIYTQIRRNKEFDSLMNKLYDTNKQSLEGFPSAYDLM